MNSKFKVGDKVSTKRGEAVIDMEPDCEGYYLVTLIGGKSKGCHDHLKEHEINLITGESK